MTILFLRAANAASIWSRREAWLKSWGRAGSGFQLKFLRTPSAWCASFSAGTIRRVCEPGGVHLGGDTTKGVVSQNPTFRPRRKSLRCHTAPDEPVSIPRIASPRVRPSAIGSQSNVGPSPANPGTPMPHFRAPRARRAVSAAVKAAGVEARPFPTHALSLAGTVHRRSGPKGRSVPILYHAPCKHLWPQLLTRSRREKHVAGLISLPGEGPKGGAPAESVRWSRLSLHTMQTAAACERPSGTV